MVKVRFLLSKRDQVVSKVFLKGAKCIKREAEMFFYEGRRGQSVLFLKGAEVSTRGRSSRNQMPKITLIYKGYGVMEHLSGTF